MRRILCGLWFVIGLALGAWCAETAVTSQRSGVVISSFIGLAFAVLAIAGAMLTNRGRRGGPLMLKVVSSLALLYTLAFVFLGGVNDRGLVYMVLVGLVAILSVTTFVMLALQQAGAADAAASRLRG